MKDTGSPRRVDPGLVSLLAFFLIKGQWKYLRTSPALTTRIAPRVPVPEGYKSALTTYRGKQFDHHAVEALREIYGEELRKGKINSVSFSCHPLRDNTLPTHDINMEVL